MSKDSESLLDFVSSMGGERMLRVEENLGDGFVRLRVSEAERRQAKHDIRSVEDVVIELLRNSRDAGAKHIFLASSKEGDIRTLTIIDDGRGIPEGMRERIFDARVTSKLDTMRIDPWGVHGRGMALYSIRENVMNASVVDTGVGKGTSISVIVDTRELPEKTDQSSWPSIGTDEEGRRGVARGPHNIIRACCEFALEERGLSVYLGTPSEIAATIRRRMQPSVNAADLLFVDDLQELPLLERLSAASDTRELLDQARGIGLEMAERTAFRITSGKVAPMRNVLARLEHKKGPATPHDIDLSKDRRGLKVSQDDVKSFSRIMERDFSFLADRYYLTLSDEPRVHVTKRKITVTFDIEEGD